MKKVIIILIMMFLFFKIKAQKNTITKTKIVLKNEFGIAYPKAKVIFSSLDTNYVVSVDQNGKAILNIEQGVEFTVSCFINETKYEFNEIIYIEKNKNIYEASIDLQFDLYEKIFEIKNLNFKSGKYNIEKQYFEELNNLVLLLTENRDINIEIAETSTNYVITIKDEGPGFSETTTEKVFKRFYSNRPANFGEHSGLGLNIVKNIVELHKGKISASNRIDKKGAQIEVLLPKSA